LNIRLGNDRHPGAHCGAFAIQPGSRMAIGVPWQQNVVVGKWIDKRARDRDDFQQFVRGKFGRRARQ
jgi:hypothetical protein